MIYLVEHDGDLATMPRSWEFWKEILPWKTRRVYESLCQSERAESTIGFALHVLAKQCGLSRTAVLIALKELEEQDFLSMYEAEGITTITVSSPPRPSHATERALDVVAASMEETDGVKADNLLKVWTQAYQKDFEQPYIATGVDKRLALRLVKGEPDLKRVVKVVRYFFENREKNDPKTFSGFYKIFADMAVAATEFAENLI